jgi:hypothetical protein
MMMIMGREKLTLQILKRKIVMGLSLILILQLEISLFKAIKSSVRKSAILLLRRLSRLYELLNFEKGM